jgi:hypothetical protein
VALDLYIGGLFLHIVAHDSLGIHKVQTFTSVPASLETNAAAARSVGLRGSAVFRRLGMLGWLLPRACTQVPESCAFTIGAR